MKENTFRANTWSAWFFAGCFLVVYNIGLLQAADINSTQTMGMFRLVSFLFVIILMMVFGAAKTLFRKGGQTTNAFAESLLLYILSELVFFCFTGEFSLFGIFYRLNIYTINYAPDLVPFRENNDMIFSCSSMIAAVASFFRSRIR